MASELPSRFGRVLLCRAAEAEAALSFSGLSELLTEVVDEVVRPSSVSVPPDDGPRPRDSSSARTLDSVWARRPDERFTIAEEWDTVPCRLSELLPGSASSCRSVRDCAHREFGHRASR
jgi:hypothetical protein